MDGTGSHQNLLNHSEIVLESLEVSQEGVSFLSIVGRFTIIFLDKLEKLENFVIVN